MTETATRGHVSSTQGEGIRLRGLTRAYPNGVTALTDVDLEVAAGEVLTVVGPSGCGKSTLLELVCGLQAPSRGTLAADPAVLMPQRDSLLPWLSALDNAALPLRVGAAPLGKAAARERAMPWLEKLGLADFAQTPPRELSGGMRQRISFARALLTDKPVLALDEPFAALDAITRAEAQNWLADALAQSPRTVILVTHDVEEAILLGDRVAVMTPRPGRIAAVVEVPLARPRRRTDVELIHLREQVLASLGAPA